jgi:hypothetical protein
MESHRGSSGAKNAPLSAAFPAICDTFRQSAEKLGENSEKSIKKWREVALFRGLKRHFNVRL